MSYAPKWEQQEERERERKREKEIIIIGFTRKTAVYSVQAFKMHLFLIFIYWPSCLFIAVTKLKRVETLRHLFVSLKTPVSRKNKGLHRSRPNLLVFVFRKNYVQHRVMDNTVTYSGFA
jgi:hypothetical protein